MKIAIIHDWLVTNAGAEKVLKEMIEIFPEADIFSIVDFLNKKDRQFILKGKYAKTTFIQKLPFSRKYFRNYLPLFPIAIESFDLRNYDVIISSSWAFAKGVKKNKKQLHVCYCHTPIRYAWDMFDEYTNNLKQPKRFVVKQILKYIRKWDYLTKERVDFFIANSNFVKNRIKNFYNKDSKVIYPPIDINKFSLCEKKEDYYITVSRLVPYKKTRLIVEAFTKLKNKKLIVIGKGEELDYLQKISTSNIKILGYVDDEKMIKYLQKAKAFIYAAIEDFGIAPVEALSCGTPVIALNKGGVRESVIENINGIFFENQKVEDIINAIYEFESINFDPIVVRESVLKFQNFKKEFKYFVESKIQEFFR